jgi:hypothetical protein
MAGGDLIGVATHQQPQHGKPLRVTEGIELVCDHYFHISRICELMMCGK